MNANARLVLKPVDQSVRVRMDAARDLLMDAEEELRRVGPHAMRKPDDRGAIYVGSAHDLLRSARYYLEPRHKGPANVHMAECYLVLGMAFGAIAASELVGQGGNVLKLSEAREAAARKVEAEVKRRSSWGEDHWQEGRE